MINNSAMIVIESDKENTFFVYHERKEYVVKKKIIFKNKKSYTIFPETILKPDIVKAVKDFEKNKKN